MRATKPPKSRLWKVDFETVSPIVAISTKSSPLPRASSRRTTRQDGPNTDNLTGVRLDPSISIAL
jgi:hypothetical protein